MLLPWAEDLVHEMWLSFLTDKTTMESLEMLTILGIKRRKNIPNSLFIQLLSSRRKIHGTTGWSASPLISGKVMEENNQGKPFSDILITSRLLGEVSMDFQRDVFPPHPFSVSVTADEN